MKSIFSENPRSKSIIKVLGVGGGGSNAVNHMFKQGIVGVDFAICNTDKQVLDISPIPTKIQLGPSLTEGRGAGSKPLVGREACIESIEDLKTFFADGTKMLFVTAGMGGGTGTGAAPVIAKAAQEMDILTVAIVTLPFQFEGRVRLNHAMEGLAELKKNVDTIIVISNDKLREIHGNLSLSAAFAQADNVLTTAAKAIAEIITVPGYVNVDFEDVNTVMRGSGVAVMGTATVEGQDRAHRAVEAALQSPLLKDNNIRGAQHVLVNISSGKQEVTMDEISIITEFVQDEAGEANLIWGNNFDDSLGDKLTVTVIATGFESGRSKKDDQSGYQQPSRNPQTPQRSQTQPLQVQPGRQEATSQQQTRVTLGQDKPSQEKPKTHSGGVYDLEMSQSNGQPLTFDFSGSAVQGSAQFHKAPGLEKPAPYVKETETQRPVANMSQRSTSNHRDTLRNLSEHLNNPDYLNQMENEPAFLRKKIILDDVPHSSESSMSRWSLGPGQDSSAPEFRENNSFLHGNID
jgi:cell division protein FtsZ